MIIKLGHYIMLSKTSVYIKRYNSETKWMYLFIEGDELLEKHNDVWEKVSNSIKKELDCEPIYDQKTSKTQNNVLRR